MPSVEGNPGRVASVRMECHLCHTHLISYHQQRQQQERNMRPQSPQDPKVVVV